MGVSLVVIIIILLDVFVTKLFFRDPVISLHIDDVEGLVELKSCPQGLEKQSELSELQIIIAILAVALRDNLLSCCNIIIKLLTGEEFLAK